MSKFLRANFNGDPNIGLYGLATDSYCLLGLEARKIDRIAKVLKVNIKIATIARTELVGIFAAGNCSGMILPKIIEKDEMKNLKGLGLNLLVLKAKETALGNLILCNDHGCVLSKNLKKFKKQIADCLNCEVGTGTIGGLEIVGSVARASNIGCLCHRSASEAELKVIEEILKVKVDIGTVNYGSPFIKVGVIVNSNGVLTSEQSTGPELGRIEEVFSK